MVVVVVMVVVVMVMVMLLLTTATLNRCSHKTHLKSILKMLELCLREKASRTAVRRVSTAVVSGAARGCLAKHAAYWRKYRRFDWRKRLAIVWKRTVRRRLPEPC